MVDDGRANRARCAAGRLQVRQQSGAGIDFDDGAALLLRRARDILNHQIDAGDVETDHARRQCRSGGNAWMYLVGDVESDVAVRLDQYLLAVSRHGISGKSLTFELENDFGAVF